MSRGRAPETDVEIRDATPQDAEAACDVLRRSISQLCAADHRNDPTILGRWPRFRGVSRALLAALEARAAERGSTSCTLTSTETAHRFYQSNGYSDDGKPVGNFGTSSGYPMSKRLPDRDS